MRRDLLIGIACIGAALWIQGASRPSMPIEPITPSNELPYSAAYTESGYPIIGSPQQIEIAQQADWLVQQFDQDVVGQDLPLPSELIMVDGLYDDDGDKLNGVAHLPSKTVKLEAQRPLREVAGTLLHERIHLAGYGVEYHDNLIYPLQKQFTQLLIQQGY